MSLERANALKSRRWEPSSAWWEDGEGDWERGLLPPRLALFGFGDTGVVGQDIAAVIPPAEAAGVLARSLPLPLLGAGAHSEGVVAGMYPREL